MSYRSTSTRGPSPASIIMSLVAIVAIVAVIWVAFFVTRFSTNPDQVGLHYKAGPFSSTTYSDFVPASTRVWDGPADQHFAYPSGQRTFSFGGGVVDNENGDTTIVDAGSFNVTDSEKIELSVRGVVTFYLDPEEKSVRDFHENIGLKFGAYSNGPASGWVSMLDVYMGQSLQRALNEATQKYTWQELYSSDGSSLEAWENEVISKLPNYIEELMGGEYFTNIQIALQKPDIPTSLKEANEDRQVAVQQAAAQEERNRVVSKELESIEELVAVLGIDGYNTYKAIENGSVTVYPIPQGSDIIVGGGSGNASIPAPSEE